MKDRLRRAWPHLRAALVLAHITVVLFFALPNTGAMMNRRAWQTRAVQLEMKTWAERLTALGLPHTQRQLEDRLYGGLKEWNVVRSELYAPLAPYHRYLGIRQPWTMFAAPHRFPARLEIDIFEATGWRPIYVARSDEFDWQATLLDHDRMRAAVFRYQWVHYEGSYRELARWLAGRAARDFPEALQIRVRLYRTTSPTPQQVKDDAVPEGKYERVLHFDPKELR